MKAVLGGGILDQGCFKGPRAPITSTKPDIRKHKFSIPQFPPVGGGLLYICMAFLIFLRSLMLIGQ